jgi:hypothetical protein
MGGEGGKLTSTEGAIPMCRVDEFDHPFPRLGEMMERLGLSPVVALQCEAAALALAIYRCQACERETVCRDWLARDAAKFETLPDFCPNSELFTRLQGKRPSVDIGCWL